MAISAEVLEVSGRITDRIARNGNPVGLDPATLLIFLPIVTQTVLGCLGVNDDTTPQTARARVVELHGKNPHRLLRRTARSVKHEAYKERGERLSYEQAEVIAQAMIDEMLETTDERAAFVCSSIPQE